MHCGLNLALYWWLWNATKSAWSTVGYTLSSVAWLSLRFCSHTSAIYFRLLNISHFRRKWNSMWQFLFSQDECLFFINVRIYRLASLLSIWLFNRLIRRIGSVLRPSRSLNGVSIRPVGGGLISSCQTKTWDDGRDREKERNGEIETTSFGLCEAGLSVNCSRQLYVADVLQSSNQCLQPPCHVSTDSQHSHQRNRSHEANR